MTVYREPRSNCELRLRRHRWTVVREIETLTEMPDGRRLARALRICEVCALRSIDDLLADDRGSP